MFPGVILPFKKKLTTKKLFIKTEQCEQKNILMEENVMIKKSAAFDFSKPSSTSKNNWTEYIKQEKPERINIEQPDNRKFFKSKVIHSDIPNK